MWGAKRNGPQSYRLSFNKKVYFLCFFFLNRGNIYIKFPILSVQSSDNMCIHIAVRPSSQSIFRTFSSFQTQTLYSLNNNPSFLEEGTVVKKSHLEDH